MAQAIPFLKLAGLLVKTLAKPIAQRIKIEASRHPRFSVYCTSLGQAVHHISSRINILASGYKFFGVKPLPPEEGRVLRMCQYRLSTNFCALALNKGVNFLSESIIFGIGGGIIIVEYRRGEQKNLEKAIASAAKERAKDEELNARFNALEERIVNLEGILLADKKVAYF